jgi:FkbM family methyltransferase
MFICPLTCHLLLIGANFGWYSAWLARLVGESGKVVSVEANPRTHELLSHTIELAGLRQHVTAVHTALYKEDGLTVSISMNPERSLNNNIRLEKAQETSGSANVQTSTLDTIMKGTGWTKVDFIKIDVEGVEDFVWEGMQWIVENNPDVIIFMEVRQEFLSVHFKPPRMCFPFKHNGCVMK